MIFKLSNFILCLSILLSFNFAFAQNTKQEVEKRIKSDEFPGDIPMIIHGFDVDLKREKFYKQRDGKTISYELKFIHRGYKYSIAVDTIGYLIDAEIKIKQQQMPKKTRQVFDKYLDDEFDKSKIEKIQSQFLPTSTESSAFLKKLIKQPLLKPDYYELVVVVKDDGDFKRFEFLIDLDGQIIEQQRVIRNGYDYIIF